MKGLKVDRFLLFA